jgi:hypothetical protein
MKTYTDKLKSWHLGRNNQSEVTFYINNKVMEQDNNLII